MVLAKLRARGLASLPGPSPSGEMPARLKPSARTAPPSRLLPTLMESPPLPRLTTREKFKRRPVAASASRRGVVLVPPTQQVLLLSTETSATGLEPALSPAMHSASTLTP